LKPHQKEIEANPRPGARTKKKQPERKRVWQKLARRPRGHRGVGAGAAMPSEKREQTKKKTGRDFAKASRKKGEEKKSLEKGRTCKDTKPRQKRKRSKKEN